MIWIIIAVLAVIIFKFGPGILDRLTKNKEKKKTDSRIQQTRAESEKAGQNAERDAARAASYQDAVKRAAAEAEQDGTPENEGIRRICAAISQLARYALKSHVALTEMNFFEQAMGVLYSIALNLRPGTYYKRRVLATFGKVHNLLWNSPYFAPAGTELASKLYDQVIEIVGTGKKFPDIIQFYLIDSMDAHGWSESFVRGLYDLALPALWEIMETYPEDAADHAGGTESPGLPGQDARKNAWDHLTDAETEELKKEFSDRVFHSADRCLERMEAVDPAAMGPEAYHQLLAALVVLGTRVLQERNPLADERAFMTEMAAAAARRGRETERNNAFLPSGTGLAAQMDDVLNEEPVNKKAQALFGQEEHPQGGIVATADRILMNALGGPAEVVNNREKKECFRDCTSGIRNGFCLGMKETAMDYGLTLNI